MGDEEERKEMDKPQGEVNSAKVKLVILAT